jgi:hypothetical protein
VRVAVVVILGAGFMSVLQPAIPPVKMGLWEKTEVTTVTVPASMEARMKQAGIVSGVPQTTKTKECYTVELWERTIGLVPAVDGCTVSKRSLSAKGAAVTLSCNARRGIVLTTDATFTFDSAETWHGEAHNTTVYPSDMMGSGGGTATSVNVFNAKYAGPECGDVTPNRPVVEK